jgi:TatD DNase family protein
MLTDTHAHLDFPDFGQELPAVLTRAREAGVARVITISTTLEGAKRAIALANSHADVWATVGVHPGNTTEAPNKVIDPLRELAKVRRVVAIGECGLDYYRLPSRVADEPSAETANEDEAVKAKQAAIFQQQLELAAELELPLVIHERDAWEDTIAQLKPFTGRVRAVFHCFGKSIDHARQILDMGHLVSFTGIVTFKNAQVVQETARLLPAGTFMVETDCPYLAPVPFRGKRCEPAYVKHTASHLAMLRRTTFEALAGETEETANQFFRFEL